MSTKRSGRTAAGDIFVAPQQGPLQNGPMLLDPSGTLIWFKALPKNVTATDFRAQTYKGKPVLTWWQGYFGAGVGVGDDVIVSNSYQTIAYVHAANGLHADLHEFQLTPQGTALLTAYFPVYMDASAEGGSKHEIVLDAVAQEIDIPTGLVLFQWDSCMRAATDPRLNRGGVALCTPGRASRDRAPASKGICRVKHARGRRVPAYAGLVHAARRGEPPTATACIAVPFRTVASAGRLQSGSRRR